MIQYRGTGRRKTSVARVRLIPGGKGIVINGKPMSEYFGGRQILSRIVEQPLVLTETLDKFEVRVNVVGGGNSGQCSVLVMAVDTKSWAYRKLKRNTASLPHSRLSTFLL